MLTKSRLIQLFIMLFLLVGLFVWRTIYFSNSQFLNSTLSKEVLDEAELCDLSKPCAFNSIKGIFYLSVDEGSVIPENWFNLTLKSDLDNWQVSSAKTIGKNMFMGKIPMKFSSVINKETKAKSMLGSCTQERMIWRFDIVVDVEGEEVNLYYDFLVSH